MSPSPNHISAINRQLYPAALDRLIKIEDHVGEFTPPPIGTRECRR